MIRLRMWIVSIGLVAGPQQNHANHQGSARLALGSRLIFYLSSLHIDVFRINMIHLVWFMKSCASCGGMLQLTVRRLGCVLTCFWVYIYSSIQSIL